MLGVRSVARAIGGSLYKIAYGLEYKWKQDIKQYFDNLYRIYDNLERLGDHGNDNS